MMVEQRHGHKLPAWLLERTTEDLPLESRARCREQENITASSPISSEMLPLARPLLLNRPKQLYQLIQQTQYSKTRVYGEHFSFTPPTPPQYESQMSLPLLYIS